MRDVTAQTSALFVSHRSLILLVGGMDMADDLQSVILNCAKLLGYTSLKEKQNEAICAFIEGCDIFVSLPIMSRKYCIVHQSPDISDDGSAKQIYT